MSVMLSLDARGCTVQRNVVTATLVMYVREDTLPVSEDVKIKKDLFSL